MRWPFANNRFHAQGRLHANNTLQTSYLKYSSYCFWVWKAFSLPHYPYAGLLGLCVWAYFKQNGCDLSMHFKRFSTWLRSSLKETEKNLFMYRDRFCWPVYAIQIGFDLTCSILLWFVGFTTSEVIFLVHKP